MPAFSSAPETESIGIDSDETEATAAGRGRKAGQTRSSADNGISGEAGAAPSSAGTEDLNDLLESLRRIADGANTQLQDDVALIRQHADRAAELAAQIGGLQATLTGALSLAAQSAVSTQACEAADRARESLARLTDSLCEELHGLIDKAAEARTRLAESSGGRP